MIVQINNLKDVTKIEKNQTLLSPNVIKKELENNPFGHYLLELENKKIIAYLYYSDIYDRAEINQIEVDVFHRNCGKASNLMEIMLETVEKSITLEVKKDNLVAIHLYKKYGFKEKAIRKGYYHGVDGILMEREKSE